ncbi:MAG: acetaldehyde dehydrogenase (acetylating) [Actinobacteria bacterium]|nr:MAG: acetaldehyde dehydrogenase (acetylating) [Actinomycetota bacterium]
MTDSSVKPLAVAILGSGNIGSDLLSKVMRSSLLECNLFVGRSLTSRGMAHANQLGVPVSDRSIEAILENPDACDLVFDATSALSHPRHSALLRELGKVVVDLTPSNVGEMCVPAVNLEAALSFPDVNMVTCGGQASIPLARAIADVHPEIEYIEVVSQIASRSAGPATRLNLDEYIETTERALLKFTGCHRAKAILNLNPAQPPVDMQTTVLALIESPDVDAITRSVHAMTRRVREYVPGYDLLIEPTVENGRLMVMVRVRGLGDFLPPYAGNLDIINCAAIAIAERHAVARASGGGQR